MASPSFFADRVQTATLAAIAVFLSSMALAVASTPGYALAGQWLSDLGVGAGALYFNAGLILNGVCVLAFFLALGSRAGGALEGRLAIAAGVLASFALAGIGLFPESAGALHSQLSLAFFSLSTLAVFLATVAFMNRGVATFWTLASAVLVLVFGGAFVLNATPFVEYNAVTSFGGWLFTVAYGMDAAPARKTRKK